MKHTPTRNYKSEPVSLYRVNKGPSRACVEGNCDDCTAIINSLCPAMLGEDKDVVYMEYVRQDYQSKKKDQTSKQTVLVRTMCTHKDFMYSFQKFLREYIRHEWSCRMDDSDTHMLHW